MKKLLVLSLLCILSGFILIACQRNQGVQAGGEQGRETGTYQPRPAPAPPKGEVPRALEMSGELQRIDMAAKTISIRVDNGMEQTFKFDDNTMVMGLEGQPTKAGRSTTSIRNLLGKEGSELTVQWRDENGVKVATHVNVTQVSTAKSTRKKGKAKGTY